MIRVSPKEPNPTHHVKLTDRRGRSMGLTVWDEGGKAPRPFRDERTYIKINVETTAQKQTSGSSSYADYDYPYSPIVQDNLSGGRGSIDFERDSTRFYDSYRCRSGRANKAYAGPLEQFTNGIRNQNQATPNSVQWQTLTGNNLYIYRRFQASAAYTAALAWILARVKGKPADLTIEIYSDTAGQVNTLVSGVTVPYTRMDDVLSEWLNETVSAALTSGVYYWIIIHAAATDDDSNHWKVAVSNSVGSTYYSSVFDTTPTAAQFDLYYRLTDANSDKTCIPFEYQEQQYFVVSPSTGAPTIFMAGDRGAADPNTGELNKLKDATKNWPVNEHTGYPVLIIDGAGKLEPQPWRTVVSNGPSELVVSPPYTIEHNTTTTYVILGTKLRSLGACGLTAPVTDVLVSTQGVAYFAMGDSVTVRRMRAFNNAGTWLDLDDTVNCQADETATTKAVFMVYKPQAKRIVIGNNSDASGNVSIAQSSNGSPTYIIPAWGTALTWDAAVAVDSKFRRINGMITHPDGGGNEAVWVFKTDVPFIIPSSGNPYPVNIDEMKTVRGSNNGVRPLRHGVYLLFPMQQGITRYYGGQFDDIGPNIGEGLPANRRGPVVWMVGYPGKFFVAIDAGGTGYSSISDSDGWHERYRAPKGQQIKSMTFQVTPGPTLDRLWIYQGNDLIWLPFPSDSTNELEDTSYPYAPEFAVILARMHAGMFDVQKLIKKIKLQTEALERDATTGQPICWFELDYRLNQDEDWTTIDDIFSESPTQEIDFTDIYGVAGKRLQFRIRGYTTDSSKTPVLLAIIVSAVIRVDLKSMFGPFVFMLQDDQRVGLREHDNDRTAAEKLQLLEEWADASNDSMLKMESVSSMCDSKMVFINMGTRRQVGFSGAENNEYIPDSYLVNVSMQEA